MRQKLLNRLGVQSKNKPIRLWLLNHWYSRTAPWFLIPFSYIYLLVMCLRYYLYAWHIKKTSYFNIPIIVVGNLTVGGSGKTPLVAWLCEYFKSQGLQPGLVSRGYGGQARDWPQPVTAYSNPHEVGDEAVMLVRQTECRARVGADRVAATRALLKHHSCDIVISDDGLQHLSLGRHLEIVVIDGDRGFGNGYCLPAGPLRESRKRLNSCDLQVSVGKPRDGACLMQLQSAAFYPLNDPLNKYLPKDFINKINTQEIHALAGIGNPQRFFQQLSQLGLKFTPHVFPDHYSYQQQDIDLGKEYIIMTEKDAVKCSAFADQRHWCFSVQAQMEDKFVEQLMYKLYMVKPKSRSEALPLS